MSETIMRMADLIPAERPANRVREVGAQAVSTRELIACILQTGDALGLANDVLHAMGGLEGLARAEASLLESVRGMGPSRVARLQAAMELGRRIAYQSSEERVQVRCPADAANVLIPLIGHQEQEHFAVLYLNTRNRIVDQEILYRGTLNTSLVRRAEVFRGAVRRNVAAIIVAHNHPSGDCNPSPEDIALTRQLVEAGKLMEIDMLDHFVIGGNRYLSLRERGLGFEDV